MRRLRSRHEVHLPVRYCSSSPCCSQPGDDLSGGAELRDFAEPPAFNKVLAYEVRMLMTDKLQLETARSWLCLPLSVGRSTVSWDLSLLQRGCRRGRSALGATLEFLSHQMAQQLGGPTEVRVESTKVRLSSG